MARLLLALAVLGCASLPLPADDTPADGADLLRDARTLFNQGKYADAAAKFADLRGQAALTDEEAAAWAYCRVKVAADTLNRPGCDPAAAAAAEADVAAAILLAPTNAQLQKVGQTVLAAARQKAGGRRDPAAAAAAAVPADWEVVETESFRVRFQGPREPAERVAQAAEAKRRDIFERWSGPAAGAWSPRCEIVLHPDAAGYAKTTGKPAAATGHATVKLADGRATERRIELRADDDTLLADALPRELTHVVLADLFPYTPPPKWAEEGMAVLAASPAEVGRYTRTLPRCARAGELFTLAVLLEMKDYPDAAKITGFSCGSVSVVDYLVKLKGEKHFTTFLRDGQRYGVAQALKRQYDLDGPKALQEAWLRDALAGRE